MLFTLCLCAIPSLLCQAAERDGPRANRIANDEKVVKIQRRGLAGIIDFMDARDDLFPQQKRKDKHMLNREQKERIWSTWIAFLDRLMVLESIEQSYADYAEETDETLRKAAFRIAYAAFLARYRHGLDFLAITERDPVFHVILNEPVPELGLGKATYSDLKYRYLHVAIASEFAALGLKSKFYGEEEADSLQPEITGDRAVIWRHGRGNGVLQTFRNGAQLVKDASFKAYFPIQKGISDWMGDVKVLRAEKSLISFDQIKAMPQRLEPGDVLLERREWYLSNIGLPGFWPHAALYVGTPAQRRDYFRDAEVAAWVKQQGFSDGSFEKLLRFREPAAYTESLQPREERHPSRVLEAIGEGVMFTSLEHSAYADSLAVLRPLRSKLEKAKAIVTAFHYSGRPYDFNFDFLTDDKLVCTELVYKAYEKSVDRIGLQLPTVEVLGRLAMPANEIVKQFDRNYGTPRQQFELVLFLDGHERDREAVEAGVETFRESWKRPKWHVITQDTVLGAR